MMIVDAAHTAIAQLDVLFIAGIVSVQTAGPFAAVTRLFTLVNYLGTAVASGVAPRLARTATTEPDARVFELGLKYVVICEGVFLAPLVVWAKSDRGAGPGVWLRRRRRHNARVGADGHLRVDSQPCWHLVSITSEKHAAGSR